MPILIFIFVGMFYFAFYLYDKVVIQISIYEMAKQIEYQENTQEKEVEKELSNRLSGRLLLEQELKVTCQNKKDDLKIKVEETIEFPFSFFKQLVLGGETVIQMKKTIPLENSSEFVRKYKVFLDGLQDVVQRAGGR